MTRRISIGPAFFLAALFFAVLRACGSDADSAERAESMRVWRAADGLPSDSVTAVIQSRDGFLWVGTSAGLARFDGVQFTALQLAASTTNRPVRITALCEDSNGHLWVGTEQAGCFELRQGRVRHFTRKEGLLGNRVTSLAADGRGRVWIGGAAGLNLWNAGRMRAFTVHDGLPDEFISGVNVARSGTVWITTRVGMCRFINGRIAPYAFQTESQGRSPEYLGAYEDRRGNLWAYGDTYLINLTEGKRFNYFRSSESASVRIWSLCEGQDGRLWIGTSGRGLFCFDNNRFQPVIFSADRWQYDVRAICEDDEKDLWLGTTGGGLVQLRPQSMHVLRAGQGLPASPPSALASDAAGRVYVGLERGGLFVGESGRFDRVGGNDQPGVLDFITSVCVDRDGGIWAGTGGDGLYKMGQGREIHLTTADGLADDNVLAVCSDSNGDVWASTGAGILDRIAGGRLARFGAGQGLPGAPVTALAAAAAGGLWLGTRDGRILRERDGTFTPVAAARDSGSHSVLALSEDPRGRLWIGTDGGGLACLAGETLARWNTSNGLPAEIIGGLVWDDAKNLWMATDAGIYRIDGSAIRDSLSDPHHRLACQLMSETRTAPDSPAVFGGLRAARSADGELWFATSEGVLNVDTRQPGIEPVSFPIYIESAAFNRQAPVPLLRGRLWSAPDRGKPILKAPADLHSLEIHFTALDFAAPRAVQFRHKLDGFDQAWVDDAGARVARYGRLPYGRYRFHVAARDAQGRWREAAATFAFIVPTPFYFQTWAIGLYVLSAIALVAGVVRMVSHRRLRVALARMEQQQSLERERMRIARDMHDEMGSKLTKISFLSERIHLDADGDGPFVTQIDSIARTSRELLQTMDEIVWVVNPRNDTLENLVAYLSHYAVEYFQNTPVECEMRLPAEIPPQPVQSDTRHNLFLSFEEALNNVLKHSAATHVRVQMAATHPDFEIQVADNGRGFEEQRAGGGPGGNGLKNMRQRLAAIGGQCVIQSGPGRGTLVTMRIHLNQARTPKA